MVGFPFRRVRANGRAGEKEGGVIELLLPRTDAGVVMQVVGVLAVFAVLLRVTWRRPDLRLVVLGSGLLLLALMGVRAAH